MLFLNWTLPSPEENLACDHALLDWVEAGGSASAAGSDPGEILRVWESARPFVVLGYAGRSRDEVTLPAAEAAGLPVLRRISGGGAVLQGSGCLNFALVFRLDGRPVFRSPAATNRWIMERHREALEQSLGRPVTVQGVTDLTLEGRKFSGNSQRRKRNAVLFHGTFLHRRPDFALMERVLPLPNRRPAYRAGRNHSRFLTSLPMKPQAIIALLRDLWGADEAPAAPLPVEPIRALAKDLYGSRAWNFRF